MTYRQLKNVALVWSAVVWLVAYTYADTHRYPTGNFFLLWLCMWVVLACWMAVGWLDMRDPQGHYHQWRKEVTP